jgi:Protein of unknown function (DUF3293)
VRAAVASAKSVTPPRRPLDATLLASYQSPPVELVVDEGGVWADASDVAARRGVFHVVSADNAYSQLHDADNARRREELRRLARERDLDVSPAIGRDPTGKWPAEEGLAVFGVSRELAQSLARAFDQYALYEVGPTYCEVVVASPSSTSVTPTVRSAASS